MHMTDEEFITAARFSLAVQGAVLRGWRFQFIDQDPDIGISTLVVTHKGPPAQRRTCLLKDIERLGTEGMSRFIEAL